MNKAEQAYKRRHLNKDITALLARKRRKIPWQSIIAIHEKHEIQILEL